MVVVVIAFAAVGVLAVGLQVLIPHVAEKRIRDRLTESGGVANVTIRAFPATRLLRNGGDRLTVRGRGLEIGLAQGTTVAEDATSATPSPGVSALDGFEQVDIELVDFRTGPFAVAAFVLERGSNAQGSYAMATRADTSAAELAAFGLERLPSIPGAAMLGQLAGPALGTRRIGLAVQIELVSENGALRVGSGGGSIAGYPAGPLATTIAAAVARRLEIAL